MPVIRLPAMQRASPKPGLPTALGRFVRGGRGLLVLGLVALVLGVALNWSWLVAAGIAPIILAVLPCLMMCGLGLCMNKAMGGSCWQQSTSSNDQPQRAISPLAFGATDQAQPINERRKDNA